MLRLKGSVQHYEWGRIGEESEVARLHARSSGDEVENKPYAELWMGTHPSGPSLVFEDENSPERGILLNDWLQEHPEALGDTVLEKWHGELPFLFKVLSIAKALSIQAHPDKRLAEHLFRTQPKIYKDPNHKPEMALALTNFEALCGFLSAQEVKHLLETVPELRLVVQGHERAQLMNLEVSEEVSRNALRKAFTSLMALEKEKVKGILRALTGRLLKEKSTKQLSPSEELVLILEKQYPDDVGVLASLFLNYIRLQPGEAVYLAANVPHAYLSGECVECMATSDNVVRAGLTPKFRDTETLSSMLSYEQGLPEILRGQQLSSFTKRYSPPFDEFEVDVITFSMGESLEFVPVQGPSIFLVSEGRGSVTFKQEEHQHSVQKGDIFFLPPGGGFHISSKAEAAVNGYANGHSTPASRFTGFSPVKLFRAGVNSRVF